MDFVRHCGKGWSFCVLQNKDIQNQNHNFQAYSRKKLFLELLDKIRKTKHKQMYSKNC